MNSDHEFLKKDLFNAAIESGRNALKAGMVINGAASISILTFIGSIATGDNAKNAITALSIPLACFVLGVLACAIASGITYLAQFYFYNSPNKSTGNWLNFIGIVFVSASYACFAFGSFTAYQVFLNWN